MERILMMIPEPPFCLVCGVRLVEYVHDERQQSEHVRWISVGSATVSMVGGFSGSASWSFQVSDVWMAVAVEVRPSPGAGSKRQAGDARTVYGTLHSHLTTQSS